MEKYILKPLRTIFADRFFLVVTVILGVAATSWQVTARAIGMHLVKMPIYLQQPLDNLEEGAIQPYNVLKKTKIENEDVVEELGTEDYIQWILEEPTAEEGNPARYVNLFITYYARPDYVPHIPEVCYTGGGNVIEERMNAELEIVTAGRRRTIPIRILHITNPKLLSKNAGTTVVYFFSSNGQYTNTRNKVRYMMRDPFDKYAYFSKVEMSVYALLPPEEVKKDLQPLIESLVPALEAGFWPAWPPKDDVGEQ